MVVAVRMSEIVVAAGIDSIPPQILGMWLAAMAFVFFFRLRHRNRHQDSVDPEVAEKERLDLIRRPEVADNESRRAAFRDQEIGWQTQLEKEGMDPGAAVLEATVESSRQPLYKPLIDATKKARRFRISPPTAGDYFDGTTGQSLAEWRFITYLREVDAFWQNHPAVLQLHRDLIRMGPSPISPEDYRKAIQSAESVMASVHDPLCELYLVALRDRIDCGDAVGARNLLRDVPDEYRFLRAYARAAGLDQDEPAPTGDTTAPGQPLAVRAHFDRGLLVVEWEAPSSVDIRVKGYLVHLLDEGATGQNYLMTAKTEELRITMSAPELSSRRAIGVTVQAMSFSGIIGKRSRPLLVPYDGQGGGSADSRLVDASNVTVPTFEALASDPRWSVRAGAARDRMCPIEVLEDLALESDPRVTSVAIESLLERCQPGYALEVILRIPNEDMPRALAGIPANVAMSLTDNPALPDRILRALADGHPDHQVQMAVVASPGISTSSLGAIATGTGPARIRAMAALDDRTERLAATQALKDPAVVSTIMSEGLELPPWAIIPELLLCSISLDAEECRRLFNHTAMTQGAVEHVVKQISQRTAEELASSDQTPPNVLAAMSTICKKEKTLRLVANNPQCPADALLFLINNEPQAVLSALAVAPHVSKTVLEAVLSRLDEEDRSQLASSRPMSQDLQGLLSLDASDRVRDILLQNKGLDPSIAAEMRRRPSLELPGAS